MYLLVSRKSPRNASVMNIAIHELTVLDIFALARMFHLEKLTEGENQLAEFHKIHSERNGYCGTIVIDIGKGCQLSVILWDAEEHAGAAIPAMIPTVRRYVEPMLARQSIVIGEGRVVFSDIV